MSQQKLKIRTIKLLAPSANKKRGTTVMVGFTFASDWLRDFTFASDWLRDFTYASGRDFSLPIIDQSNINQMQTLR